MSDDELISISKKLYNELVADANMLSRLEAAGVDNWYGYSIALEDDDDEEVGNS